MNINYTIIIPHKNIPLLLYRCLSSIPIREDIQVIVVDDNSSSDIVDFNSFPGISRPNLEVVLSKESRGAGYARNIGLTKAKGKWILFADSDDFFLTNFLKTVDNYCESDFDVIFFTPESVDSQTLEKSYRADEFKEMIEDALISLKDETVRYKYYVPHSKVIKRSFVENYNIQFDETLANNDCLFSVKVGHYAQNLLILRDSIYSITSRSGSLITTFSVEVASERLKASLKVNEFVECLRKNQFRMNLIPLIFVRNASPFFKGLIYRLKLVGFKYFFTFFIVDISQYFRNVFMIFFNKKKRNNYLMRRTALSKS